MKKIIAFFVSAVILISMLSCSFPAMATEYKKEQVATESSEATKDEATKDEVPTDATEPSEATKDEVPTTVPSESTNDTTPNGSSEPTESTKETVPSGSSEPTESTKETAPSGSSEPTESTKETTPSGSSEPTESTSETTPSESSKPSETTKPTKPSETTQPTTAKVIKPQRVEKFVVAQKKKTSIKLNWTKGKNATKYLLYRGTEDIATSKIIYKKIKTIKNANKTTYTDKNLETGKIYKYKLYSVREENGKTLKSNAKTVSTFLNLLPSGKITVKKATTSKVSLAWNRIHNASRYEIYRKGANSKSYKRLAVTGKCAYTDKNVTSGLDYTYKVRGYRVANNKTRYSGFVSVNTSAGVVGVKGITAKSYLRKGLFTWKESKGADGYDVYVLKKNGKYKYKDTVTTSVYLTGRLTKGKTYKYKFVSFKNRSGKKIYGKSSTAKVNIVDTAYGKTVGKNYIEVSVATQTVYMYVNNKLVVKTPVVTGHYKAFDTTKGYHYIISKKSPARLKGEAAGSQWDVNVKYWLGFTYDGQGLHDSSWRTSGYGGTIYKRDGSHGCVNTPTNAMSKIFKKAKTGTAVIVY